jgi:hypothetical protein
MVYQRAAMLNSQMVTINRWVYEKTMKTHVGKPHFLLVNMVVSC